MSSNPGAYRVENAEVGKECLTHRLDVDQQALAGPHPDRVPMLLTSCGKYRLHGLPRRDIDLGGCDIGMRQQSDHQGCMGQTQRFAQGCHVVTFLSISWILAARTVIPAAQHCLSR